MSAPPVISVDMFEAAKKQLLHNREFARRNKKREYLYSKLIYCSKCGHKMFGGFQPPRKKWEYEGGRYYHGIYRKKDAVGTSKRCEWCPQYSEARLEPIWDCLKEIIKNPKNMTAPLKEYIYQEDDPRVIQDRLVEINYALSDIQQKQTRLTDLLIADKITDEKFEQHEREYARDEQKLTDEATRLRQNLLSKNERAEREEAIQKAYKHIRAKLDDVSYEEKAKIISIFVQRITLHAQENYAEVVFRFHRDTTVPNKKQVSQLDDSFLLVLKIRTISESERRAFMLRVNPGMYIPKSLV
jgi:hypothetical protein